MTVQIDNDVYLVRWTNISERMVHDDGWSLNADKRTWSPPAEVVRTLRDPALKRYLRLREPRRVSLMTTVCEIQQQDGILVSKGWAFYSRSEVEAGVRFSRPRAKITSLKRALGVSVKDRIAVAIDHHMGKVWTPPAVQIFLDAFGTLMTRRPSRRTSVHQKPVNQG